MSNPSDEYIVGATEAGSARIKAWNKALESGKQQDRDAYVNLLRAHRLLGYLTADGVRRRLIDRNLNVRAKS